MNMLTRLNRGDGLFPVTLRGVDDIFRTMLGQLAPDFTPEMMWDSGLAPKLGLGIVLLCICCNGCGVQTNK